MLKRNIFFLYRNIKSGDLTVSRDLVLKLSRDVVEKESVEKITAMPLPQESSFLWATKTNRLKTSLLEIVKEIVIAIVTVRYALFHTSDRFCCVTIEKGTHILTLICISNFRARRDRLFVFSVVEQNPFPVAAVPVNLEKIIVMILTLARARPLPLPLGLDKELSLQV